MLLPWVWISRAVRLGIRMPFLAGGALKTTALNSSGASSGLLKSSFSRSLATLKPVKPPVPRVHHFCTLICRPYATRPHTAEQSRAEQSRAEQSRAEQSTAELSTGQDGKFDAFDLARFKTRGAMHVHSMTHLHLTKVTG